MNKSTDTRQRLVDSARELIYSRSYGDVGVQAICEHAGVRKGSFYHFFSSKRELALAAVDEFLVIFKDELLTQAFASDLPPMARFGRLIDLVYQQQKEIKEESGALLGCPFGNLAMEMSTQDEVMRSKLELIFALLREPFEENLRQAVAAGELSADTDIDGAAQAVLAYMEGVVLLAKARNDPELIRQLGPRVTLLCQSV
jgi:TetR/AcrR family transcriptional repressor of nem operon